MSEQPIPAEIFERAEILVDQFRHCEDDREFVARILMEVATPTAHVAGMTERQAGVLNFVRSFSAEHNYSPSYQQIADALGLRSKSRICEAVTQLEERGLLQRLPRRSRSLHINIVGRA